MELLGPLLGYSRGGGVDARWVVISGSGDFFGVTKRLHNHLHGYDVGRPDVSDEERGLYEQTLEANAAELVDLVRPRDIVILHDPQTAGLVSSQAATGATVIWRCHVGLDRPNELAQAAWAFLRPYVLPADAYVFSRAAFVWGGLDQARVATIQPSIDAFSPKNQDLEPEQALAILSRAAIVPHRETGRATFIRSDGTPGRVDCQAEMLEVAPLRPEDRFVLQVSRWDALKDPLGVLAGFAERIAGRTDAHLLLAGPSADSVTDDPEGAQVYAAVRATWSELPADIRRRVHVASLSMTDAEENAATVNALQRHAAVVVQKSLAEGFGLTVAEAMWKRRPVVASAVGGIQDQIVDGVSGLLLLDARDLAKFGDAVVSLLNDRGRSERIGAAARERVREHFLGPDHLAQYFKLIQRLDARLPAA